MINSLNHAQYIGRMILPILSYFANCRKNFILFS
jgi:hypothetical protein